MAESVIHAAWAPCLSNGPPSQGIKQKRRSAKFLAKRLSKASMRRLALRRSARRHAFQAANAGLCRFRAAFWREDLKREQIDSLGPNSWAVLPVKLGWEERI